jgi:hypothetical protein
VDQESGLCVTSPRVPNWPSRPDSRTSAWPGGPSVAIADEVSFRSLHGGPRLHPGSVGVPGLFSPLLLFGHLFSPSWSLEIFFFPCCCLDTFFSCCCLETFMQRDALDARRVTLTPGPAMCPQPTHQHHSFSLQMIIGLVLSRSPVPFPCHATRTVDSARPDTPAASEPWIPMQLLQNRGGRPQAGPLASLSATAVAV